MTAYLYPIGLAGILAFVVIILGTVLAWLISNCLAIAAVCDWLMRGFQ